MSEKVDIVFMGAEPPDEWDSWGQRQALEIYYPNISVYMPRGSDPADEGARRSRKPLDDCETHRYFYIREDDRLWLKSRRYGTRPANEYELRLLQEFREGRGRMAEKAREEDRRKHDERLAEEERRIEEEQRQRELAMAELTPGRHDG